MPYLSVSTPDFRTIRDSGQSSEFRGFSWFIELDVGLSSFGFAL